MRTAVGNAARIEREAVERAREIEQQATRKSGEMLSDAFKRAWRILDGIDLLESGVSDMIHALRTEMEGFAGDLGIALPGPEPESARENGAGSARASMPSRRLPGAGALKHPEHEGSHAEVEQMITEQVAILFREGRPRAEAEHLVMRFKQGGDYLHVIDDVYG
jgi:hypothetical protein